MNKEELFLLICGSTSIVVATLYHDKSILFTLLAALGGFWFGVGWTLYKTNKEGVP